MIITTGQLIGFTLASLVIIVIPGPGVLFVVGRALSHGRRTASATAAGHAAGNYVVAACIAVGLGRLLQRSHRAREARGAASRVRTTRVTTSRVRTSRVRTTQVRTTGSAAAPARRPRG